MKKLTYIIVSLLLYDCSNELELFTEQKIEPIITSLIDLYSTDHYVRIQKTYQEFNENVHDVISWSTNKGWSLGSGPYILTPERIFNRLNRNLENNNNLIARNLLGIDLIGRIPDPDFKEMHLTSINRADLNNKPYTNYDIGYGIFVGFVTDTLLNAVLDYRTMDSLVLSPKWKHLKFKTY